MFPISRLTFAVHDGDDEDEVWLNGIEHQVWKHAHQTTPHIFFEHAPALRRLDDLSDGNAHFAGKALAQSRPRLL